MSERSYQEDMEFAGMDEEPKDEYKSELEKRVDYLELVVGEIQRRLAIAGAPMPSSVFVKNN